MVWFFLIGAAFFVLGGLLSVQPNKTQKRIAGLREAAMKAGLHVKLPMSLKFPEGVVKSETPYYCKNLLDRRLSHQFVHVLRLEDGSIKSKSSGNSESEYLFEQKLKSMPSEFNAIYLGSGLLGVSWSEAAVTDVPQTLLECLSEIESKLISKA